MTFVAITVSANFQITQEATLAPGQSLTVGRYELTLQSVATERESHRLARRAMVHVARSGESVGVLGPALNQYPTQREPLGTPAVRSTLTHDLYLTLMNLGTDGTVGLRAIVTPAVVWIWIGVLIMAGGTALCLVSPARLSKERIPGAAPEAQAASQ